MNEENKHEKTQAEAVDGAAQNVTAADESSPGPDSAFQPSFQPSTQGDVGISAGAMLRHARETAGVDLSSLALALKISVKKLEALEANRHEELTDSVFIRALASSVCRTLKIDAAPILARLPKSNAPKLVANDETGLNAPFRTPADVAKTPFWEHLSRPVVLATLAVLLAALILILFPSSKTTTTAGPAAAPSASEGQSGDAVAESADDMPKDVAVDAGPGISSTSAAVPQASIPAAPLVTSPMTTPGTAQGGAASAFSPAAGASRPVPATPPTAAVPAALTPSATPSILARGTSPNGAAPNLATVPARAAAVAPAAQPAAAVPAPQAVANADDEEEPKFSRSGAVVFRLREPGWVQVTDASGTIRINRVLEANTPVGVVNGPFPLTVIVGRPEVTAVQVRGRPFDLTPTIVNGQAKFEVQ
ncbi:helix-turn-helix domain-containing protein [Hylemonella gracilis]|nr:RodZ domain-containing protein [Hylemonella gracilis]